MRKWNFCAGPAAIPEEVLIEAQNELLGVGSLWFFSHGGESSV